jgi:hypothetical protein
MYVLRFFKVIALPIVLGFFVNQCATQILDPGKLIGKTYKSYSELHPQLVEGSSQSIGPDGEIKYYITMCGKKPWTPGTDDPEVAFIFLDSIVKYAGNSAIFRVLDVREIHIKNFAPNSEIRIGECTTQEDDTRATVGIYSTVQAAATVNGIKPQEVWKADLKTFKFVEVPADRYLCMPENVGEGDEEE